MSLGMSADAQESLCPNLRQCSERYMICDIGTNKKLLEVLRKICGRGAIFAGSDLSTVIQRF